MGFRSGFLTLAACAAVGLAGVAGAQDRTIRNTGGPAEVPPASFDGRQYVDSQGCVFIRAGRAGAVRWVPRVRRDRSVVCGQAPSTPQQAAPVRAATAPTPTPTPRPTRTPETTATASAAPAATVRAAEPVLRRAPAAAAPRRIVADPPAPSRAAPAAAPRRTIAAPAAVHRPERVARPAPAATPAPRRVLPSSTSVRRGAATQSNGLPAACAGAQRLASGALRASRSCVAALQASGVTVRTAGAAPVRAAAAAPVRAARPAATAPARQTTPRVARTACDGTARAGAARCAQQGRWTTTYRRD